MNDIKISVVVPVYNVQKYLNRCIETILTQTFNLKYEIILVDDGSTDDSGKICDKYKMKYEFIKVIHKKNAGLGFARNTGIENAEGKYITFIDSDDYIHKDMLMDLYNAAENNEADICYSDFFRDNNNFISCNCHLEGLGGIYSGNEIKEKIIPWMVGGSPADLYDDILGYGVWKSIYSANIINNYNIRFHSEAEMISEDIIFQLDYLTYTKKAVVLEKAYYFYCLNSGSLSTVYREDRKEKNLFLYNEQLKRLRIIGIENTCKIRADRLLIASTRMDIMSAVKFLNIFAAIKRISQYKNDEEYCKVFNTYPISQLPKKQKIFAILLKKKLPVLIFFLTKIYIFKNYRK